MLDPHCHHVQPIGIGHQHDLELVAYACNRAHGVLDLARKHLDAAQVDQVVGASGKGTDGADVRPAAATARAVERRVVADQKTKLRRGF